VTHSYAFVCLCLFLSAFPSFFFLSPLGCSPPPGCSPFLLQWILPDKPLFATTRLFLFFMPTIALFPPCQLPKRSFYARHYFLGPLDSSFLRQLSCPVLLFQTMLCFLILPLLSHDHSTTRFSFSVSLPLPLFFFFHSSQISLVICTYLDCCPYVMEGPYF